jgi:hypothetical protein
MDMEGELNRAKTLWRNWEQIEHSLGEFGELTRDHPLDLAREKYDFLREGVYRLSDKPLLQEKPYLAMISAICNKLQKQLYPNRFMRVLHQAKAFVYDKPNVLGAHRMLIDQNLSDLKKTFGERGLGELALKLNEPIDYEKQQLDWKVNAFLDRLRTVSFSPVLKKDGLGFFRLEQIRAQCFSADHTRTIDVVLPKEYHLNREQIVNLLQDRPVYVHPGKLEGVGGKWLQLQVSTELGRSGLSFFETLAEYDLKKELSLLAADTGIFRLTATDVLVQLRRGNTFQITGRHPGDEPFLIQAAPADRGIKLMDKNGIEIAKEDLLKGLQNGVLGQDKNIQNQLELLKTSDKPTDLGQGLSV